MHCAIPPTIMHLLAIQKSVSRSHCLRLTQTAIETQHGWILFWRKICCFKGIVVHAEIIIIATPRKKETSRLQIRGKVKHHL